MEQITAGVASVDITPPPGMLLAGFAARSGPATDTHDPLTVRALVAGNTGLVVADTIGITRAMSERIRRRCILPDGNVIVAATHTHGAPHAAANTMGATADATFLAALEDGCVAAIDRATAAVQPTTITAGYGSDPNVARNRRHADGPLDRSLPVIKFRDQNGSVFAVLVSYACHPTVLGADNRKMTADFPHFVRERLEGAYPGAVAVFVNGCCGDINIGHTAQASWTTQAQTTRTFENAERLGKRIAEAALTAPDEPVTGASRASSVQVSLPLDRPEGKDLDAAAEKWQAELDAGVPASRACLLPHWISWARENVGKAPGVVEGRVSVIELGDVAIVGLPGEIFAETGLAVRAASSHAVTIVASYADDAPGYIPPSSEFAHGGYEVNEAYRFSGLPGRFSPGCAEKLRNAAINLMTTLR